MQPGIGDEGVRFPSIPNEKMALSSTSRLNPMIKTQIRYNEENIDSENSAGQCRSKEVEDQNASH
jgi:hypothetical protein